MPLIGSAVQLVFFRLFVFRVISLSICNFAYLSEINGVVIYSIHFKTRQDNFIICTKCFKNGNYGEKRSMEDFILNESSEISANHSAIWTEGETLLLLESVLKHGDDWELVVQSVKTKTKLECISKLIELPFGELMLGSARRNGNSYSVTGIMNNGKEVQPSSSDHQETPTTQETSTIQDQSLEPNNENEQNGDAVNESPLKKQRVAPLSDSSSSLMKQVRDNIEFHIWLHFPCFCGFYLSVSYIKFVQDLYLCVGFVCLQQLWYILASERST
jgi:hypothetical protein